MDTINSDKNISGTSSSGKFLSCLAFWHWASFCSLWEHRRGFFIMRRKSYYSGEIIEITNGNLIIRGRGGIQETIAIERDTLIKKGEETVKDGLEIGDRVIVVGLPNESGQIEAKLIRILEGNETKNMKRFLKPPFLDNNSEK